jgi:fructose-1,6-bisphosphatase I
MDKVFNAIVNVATEIENNVFTNYDQFVVADDLEQTNVNVQQYCDKIARKEFKSVENVKAIVTQDDKKTEVLNEDGRYIVSLIAIDNIDILDLGFSVGSIFGIYDKEIEGHSLVAGCYVTYGPTFQLVYATKETGVEFYAHNGTEFIDVKPFKLENKGKINSTDGDVATFSKEHNELIQGLFNEGYRLRLSNSLALDMHQILFKRGGLYSSPRTKKDPDGRIDVVFEAYPIAYIIELAGGEAIDGEKNISDVKINGDLSKKTPIYFGSKYEIGKVKAS